MADNHEMVSGGLTTIADALRLATVQVRDGGPGSGSGIIWRQDGLIITNAHVAHRSEVRVELADGRQFSAALVARDAERDLAALVLAADDLPAVPIGDSDHLRAGELVVALGNPLGLSGALAVGIVHCVGSVRGRHGNDWVRADIQLAPGNSGGPLADAAGRVVGVNTMVAGRLGLAVPSRAVLRFVSRLEAHYLSPHIGIEVEAVRVSSGEGEPPATGLLVLHVQPSSPSDAAGLIIGDVIMNGNGHRLASREELLSSVRDALDGRLELAVIHGGRTVMRVLRTLDFHDDRMHSLRNDHWAEDAA